jgi:electron transfer flavoprotein beta subunit
MSRPLAVCLKSVHATSVPLRLDPSGRAIRADESPMAVNPADLAALGLALGLLGGAPERRVLALTVGPFAWEEPLRFALAAGASEALRVWNPAWPSGQWEGAVDGSAAHTRLAAEAAAEALRSTMGHDRPGLVLTGEASADAGHGCFGAFLAHALGAAFAHRAVALEPDGADWRVRVKLERGYTQEMALRAPAVVTVSAALPAPPYPSLPAWMASRTAIIRTERSALPYPTGTGMRLRAPVPRVKRYQVPEPSLNAEARIRAMVEQPTSSGGAVIAAEAGAEAQAEAILKLLGEKGYSNLRSLVNQ